MNKLQYFWNHLANSQLIVSLAAAALFAMTQMELIDSCNWYFVFLMFFSTWFMYMAHRFIGLLMNPALEKAERFGFLKTYSGFILSLATVFGIGLLYIVSQIWKELEWGKLIIPVLVVLSYSLPIFRRKRLRDLPYIKLFAIGLIWSFLTVAMTFKGYPTGLVNLATFLMLERILFIIAITIPFDIRDEQVDREANVSTLVTWLGEKKSKIIALILLAICIALLSYGMKHFDMSPNYYFACLAMYAISAILIKLSHANRSESFFSGLMESTMILGPLAYLILENWN